MNRCSQIISDKCTSLLATCINQSKPTLSDRLTFKGSLKYLILFDSRIAIDINQADRFEAFEVDNGQVIANGPALSEARVSDFLLGANRVRTQYDSLRHIKNSGSNSAWLLISAYYCAFFSCIEICKLFNRISFSLEAEDLDILKRKAIGPAHADFFAAGHSNFVGTEYAGKLIFRSVGIRPHQMAWDSMHQTFRELFSKRGWSDALQYTELLGNQDYSPSRIRNIWNYKRSDYFGATGENKAIEFRKLLGNSEGAYSWLTRRGKADVLDPCVVAVLCEALAVPVVEAAQRAGELLRQAGS